MAPSVLQTYMLKLSKSGEDGEKAFLVLESGSRFHTTQVGKGVSISFVAKFDCVNKCTNSKEEPKQLLCLTVSKGEERHSQQLYFEAP